MDTAYKGTNKMITGIVFGVLTFWLFAQAMVNVVPAVQEDLGVSSGTINIAISLTALFSGIFIVAAGGLADKIGRKKITNIGLILSIIGSLCLVLANGATLLIIGRVIQGLSAACGFALACRHKKIDNNIYVLMGDGEQQKGQISEARRFAVKYNLRNIIGVCTFKPAKNNKNDFFRIAYYGTIYSDRNPSLLFDSLDLILNQGGNGLNRLRVEFYGVTQEALSPYLKDRPCARLVHAKGRIPFHRVVEIEQQSTVLLLLTHPSSKGIITSKIYEYLGAQRPILAIPGDGDVIDELLKETDAGISCCKADHLADLIISWYECWAKGQPVIYKGITDKIFQYTRLNQTGQMVKILNTVSSRVYDNE